MHEDVDRISTLVHEAIETWLSDNGGGLVTAFALSAEYIDSDGDRCWALVTADGQSASQTLGLLRWHTMDVERQCLDQLRDADE